MSLYEDLMEKMQGKPYAGYFMSICPFRHDGRYEQNPSLMVHEDGYHCTSCHKKGSLVFLAKVIGLSKDYSPQQKIKVIPHFRKWLEQYGTMEEIAYSAHKFIKANRSYSKYLRDRKADQWIEPGLLGFKDGWITIPVRDKQGKIVNLICRGISKDKARYVLFRQDDTPRLYVPDWKLVKSQEVIYVPFGIFDSFSLYDLGLASVTGTTGTSLSAELLKPLDKKFVIIPDKGEERSAYHLESGLGWHGNVIRLKYPEGCKDMDEIRRKYGKTALLNLLEANNGLV